MCVSTGVFRSLSGDDGCAKDLLAHGLINSVAMLLGVVAEANRKQLPDYVQILWNCCEALDALCNRPSDENIPGEIIDFSIVISELISLFTFIQFGQCIAASSFHMPPNLGRSYLLRELPEILQGHPKRSCDCPWTSRSIQTSSVGAVAVRGVASHHHIRVRCRSYKSMGRIYFSHGFGSNIRNRHRCAACWL